MTTTTLNHASTSRGTPRATPRTAAPAAGTPRPGFWQRVWIALEAHGQRRAAHQLRLFAAHHVTSDPELAQRLRELARQV